MPPAVFRSVYQTFLSLGHDDRDRREESVSEHLPFYERADGAAAMVRQARSLDSADTMAVADGIPHLDVPARVVWGTADKFQPIGYGYRLAYELGATLERVEGGKHFTPEDHPEPIAQAVRSVLLEV
jgi:pimeloyl-ACP methyl ester carboxylesterase